MPTLLNCAVCRKEFSVTPARAGTAKFCSYACAGKFRSEHQRGENHGRWLGGERYKTCIGCGSEFSGDGKIFTIFVKQKFCSKPCADKHGLRYEGEQHPNYKAEARRRNGRGKHGAWARKVISRDLGKCQHCGATEGLHAHHVKSYEHYPELRVDVDNGLTLCFKCHWEVHAASNENAVNSVDPLTDDAEGNTEPSSQGNLLEGVTTRGRAYRRWVGSCEECGQFISRPLSDAEGKKHHFCSRSCAGKFKSRIHGFGRPVAHGSNASTSPAPEREDIV